MEHKCVKYALACYEYYRGDGTIEIMNDSGYDLLARWLHTNWSYLPRWFTKKFGPKRTFVGGGFEHAWRINEEDLRYYGHQYSERA